MTALDHLAGLFYGDIAEIGAFEEVLAEAVRQYLDAYREKRIRAEAKAWYALPTETRNQYRGFFVAVYNGEIVESDPNQRTLYLRAKERFGREPVLLVEGGDQPMPVYQSYSAYGS